MSRRSGNTGNPSEFSPVALYTQSLLESGADLTPRLSAYLDNAAEQATRSVGAGMESLGSAIHEHGTCRMGADPKRSALNSFCQMHEVKNVFVVDGSAFTTASEKNPTLTIMALSWRTSDYLLDQAKKGNL